MPFHFLLGGRGQGLRGKRLCWSRASGEGGCRGRALGGRGSTGAGPQGEGVAWGQRFGRRGGVGGHGSGTSGAPPPTIRKLPPLLTRFVPIAQLLL